MASTAKKVLIRAVAWLVGIVLGASLFLLVGISLLVDAINRLVHWGKPNDEQAARAQAKAASAWWSAMVAKAGSADKAAVLSGPAPVEELARLVKEEPAIVLNGESRDPRPLVVLRPYARRFGPGALAYTTITNAEFKHYFVPGVGAIPYLQCRRYGRRVVMACNDPLAPKSMWQPLTERFFAFEPTAYVSHASAEYAKVLRAMGKIINHFGIEPIIKAREYDFNGPQMRTSRQEIRRARDAGLVVRELTALDLADPSVRARLDAVSGDWMRTKRVADRQLRVYCRHFDVNDLAEQLDGDVRLFVAERRAGVSGVPQSEGGGGAAPPAPAPAPSTTTEPEIEGFMLVDPMYREDGQVFGYVNSSNRMRPGAHPGTLKLLMEHCLDLIRTTEGMQYLHLGLTPFHHSKRCAHHFPGGAKWMDASTEFFFQLGNNLYAFKRLAAAKSKFGGGIAPDGESYNDPSVIMSHVYVAHSIRVPFLFLMDMYAQFEYIGFVGDDILSSLVKGLAPPVKKDRKPVLNQVGRKELRRLASSGGLSSAGGALSEAGSLQSVPSLLRTASSGGGGAPVVLRPAVKQGKGPKGPAQPPQQLQAAPKPPRPLVPVSSAPAGLSTPPQSVAPRRVSRPPTLPPMPGSPPAQRLDSSVDAAVAVVDDGRVAAAVGSGVDRCDEGGCAMAAAAAAPAPAPADASAGASPHKSNSTSGSAVSLTAVAALPLV